MRCVQGNVNNSSMLLTNSFKSYHVTIHARQNLWNWRVINWIIIIIITIYHEYSVYTWDESGKGWDETCWGVVRTDDGDGWD